jgi:AcrR family transcriptional regulator
MQDQGPSDGKAISDEDARRRIEIAMLVLSGELGYRAVTLDLLLERSGASPEQFKTHFDDLEACFLAAYEAEADDLCSAMLAAAGGERDWHSATTAALGAVLQFAAIRPQIARSLVREVHIVGGAAVVKHEEVLERLAGAMEEDCQAPFDQGVVRRAPTFVVGAIETVIAGHLDRGEQAKLLDAAPELVDLIATFFIDRRP